MTKATGRKTYRLVLKTTALNGKSKGKGKVKDQDGEKDDSEEPVLPIKGVIFDMDGTLTRPQTWMFGEMRRQLGVPKGVDILDHVASIPTEEGRMVAQSKLRTIEEKAMREQEPTKGLKNVFTKLSEYGVHTSICTRNFPKPVGDFCRKFLDCNPYEAQGVEEKRIISGPIVTREFDPPKPSPKPLLHIISSWGVSPQQVIMVGDSTDDMDAGLAAGCAVILLRHEDNSHVENAYIADNDDSSSIPSGLDAVVSDLDHLSALLESGLKVAPKS